MILLIIVVAAIIYVALQCENNSNTHVITGVHYHAPTSKTTFNHKKTNNRIAPLTQKEFVQHVAKKKIICL